MTIAMRCGSDILWVPEEDLSNPKKMLWWNNVNTSGNDPILEAKIKAAWPLYLHRVATGKFPTHWDNFLIRASNLWNYLAGKNGTVRKAIRRRARSSSGWLNFWAFCYRFGVSL